MAWSVSAVFVLRNINENDLICPFRMGSEYGSERFVLLWSSKSSKTSLTAGRESSSICLYEPAGTAVGPGGVGPKTLFELQPPMTAPATIVAISPSLNCSVTFSPYSDRPLGVPVVAHRPITPGDP